MRDNEEAIEPDYDRPISAEWLARAYDAIFTPVAQEDADLDFDPDDYPLT